MGTPLLMALFCRASGIPDLMASMLSSPKLFLQLGGVCGPSPDCPAPVTAPVCCTAPAAPDWVVRAGQGSGVPPTLEAGLGLADVCGCVQLTAHPGGVSLGAWLVLPWPPALPVVRPGVELHTDSDVTGVFQGMEEGGMGRGREPVTEGGINERAGGSGRPSLSGSPRVGGGSHAEGRGPA